MQLNLKMQQIINIYMLVVLLYNKGIYGDYLLVW